jgi:hypothetical protein
LNSCFFSQVNREMNNLIETLKKRSEEETVDAQQDVDGVADADEAEDVDEEVEDDDVGDADEDEAGVTTEGPDKSDLSDDAVENGVENGKAVISAKAKGKKVLNSLNGKVHGGAGANGKSANTKEVQGEKLDAPDKRIGGGGGRASKKAKRDA